MALRQRLYGWFPWLRAADLRLVAELVVIVVLVLVFVQIGDAVTEGDPQQLDERILLALRDTPADPVGPPWLENAMMHLSALGSGVVTGLVALIAVGFLILARRPAYAALVALCVIGTGLGMYVLKSIYERPRPTVVTHVDPPGGLSFPSGHSMISVALYLTLAVLVARALDQRRLRVFAVAVGVLLAVVIGFTRLYLGVHYPTDVLAGWTAGLGWALVCGLIARRLGNRGTVEDGGGDDVTAPST